MNELIFSEMKLGFQTNHKFYGTPSIILTVCGCKYECVKNGEPCKVANISNNKYTIKDAKEFVLKNNHIKYIVIDGGEPLLYKKQIEQLLTEIYSVDKFIIVYTKGGLPILNPLNPKFKVYLYIIDLQDKELPKPGDKIIRNNKEFVYGTNDIEQMTKFNINTIRDICVYCNEYLILFQSEPSKILEKAKQVVDNILDTTDEFAINFLKKYNPKNNIVFSSRNKEEQTQIEEICLKNGILFNKIY